MAKRNTFDTTYNRYPFAPLVTFGVAVAAWLKETFGGTGVAEADQAPSKPGALGHAA